jgi:hypothetical protein
MISAGQERRTEQDDQVELVGGYPAHQIITSGDATDHRSISRLKMMAEKNLRALKKALLARADQDSDLPWLHD